jgi:glutamate racemase
MDNRPIGVIDSGVGGLTIWRELRALLPRERLVYLADGAYAPYGERGVDVLRERARLLTERLLGLDVKLVVVACNTLTVHAIGHLRAMFPNVPFVGVVPVVKTLARETRSGTIAILSTPATAASPYLADLIATFAPGKRVVNAGCEGLAEMVERGEPESDETLALLERHLAPVRASGADVVGLGCTHYPFVQPRIQRLLGPSVRIYEPAAPVARRAMQVLAERNALAGGRDGDCRFFSTGAPAPFATVAGRLLGVPAPHAGHVSV